MLVLLAHVFEDCTDIIGILGGGLNTPNHPPWYATAYVYVQNWTFSNYVKGVTTSECCL